MKRNFVLLGNHASTNIGHIALYVVLHVQIAQKSLSYKMFSKSDAWRTKI